jgi:ribosome biogenesis protein ERB1
MLLLLLLLLLQGAKIDKKQRGDKLEQLLARNDSSKALRTIYDAYNDEDIVLSKEELKMIMRIRKGQFPHVEVRQRSAQQTLFCRFLG